MVEFVSISSSMNGYSVMIRNVKRNVVMFIVSFILLVVSIFNSQYHLIVIMMLPFKVCYVILLFPHSPPQSVNALLTWMTS